MLYVTSLTIFRHAISNRCIITLPRWHTLKKVFQGLKLLEMATLYLPLYFYYLGTMSGTTEFFGFLLEYNCFTILCWVLLYNSVNQPCVYISPSPFRLPPIPLSHSSRSSQSTRLSPCAAQQLPTGWLFYMVAVYICQCSCVNLSHPLLPPLFHKSILYIWVSIPAVQIGSLVPFF